MLSGEEGEAKALAMKVVVKVGEALGAESLVPIKNAHISGISYKNVGEEGLAFIEELASAGAVFSVPTTLNPGAFDLSAWRKMNVDEKLANGQLRIISAFRKMGATITLTCTPYLYSSIEFGDHLAWSESSAVLYANSVIGARTNRDGGPLALFEAIVGRAPMAGLHLVENRKPAITLDFTEIGERVEREGLLPVAGLVAGRLAGASVPLVKGLRFRGNDEVKLFLAAVGATGGTGLVLIEGVSPELRSANHSVTEGTERVRVDWKAIQDELSRYGSAEGSGVVVLGCPHLSSNELKEMLEWFRRHGKPRRRVLLFTSRQALSGADREAVEEIGAEIYTDTCMVVSDLSRYAGREVVTDSGKAAFYLASQGYAVRLTSREKALRYAVGEAL